ncbi:MAG: hypothetical protein ACYSWQ_22905, partial [Planctomycetota bacterium]
MFRGGLRYTPPQSYVGKDIIVYTIADSTGLLNTDLVSIEVINGWLAAHWRLDEVDPSSPRFVAGRHAFDASGNGHDALLPENYESVPGVDGRAIKIPSGSSMICDDSSIVPAAPDHWVKPLWHSYPVEEQASNFFDPMDASFSLKFSFNVLYKTKELEWDDMVHPGTWYHVTMVIDRSNNTLRAWVDGQLVSGN